MKLGVPLSEQADLPAVQLDWLLALDKAEAEVAANASSVGA